MCMHVQLVLLFEPSKVGTIIEAIHRKYTFSIIEPQTLGSAPKWSQVALCSICSICKLLTVPPNSQYKGKTTHYPNWLSCRYNADTRCYCITLTAPRPFKK